MYGSLAAWWHKSDVYALHGSKDRDEQEVSVIMSLKWLVVLFEYMYIYDRRNLEKWLTNHIQEWSFPPFHKKGLRTKPCVYTLGSGGDTRARVGQWEQWHTTEAMGSLVPKPIGTREGSLVKVHWNRTPGGRVCFQDHMAPLFTSLPSLDDIRFFSLHLCRSPAPTTPPSLCCVVNYDSSAEAPTLCIILSKLPMKSCQVNLLSHNTKWGRRNYN